MISIVRKRKVNAIEVLIFALLIDSFISHDEFVSVNNILREYNEMKKEIKIPETSVEYIMQNQSKPIVSVVRNTENKNSDVRRTKENRLMILSNCAVCGRKKLAFIKNKETHNFD